LIGEATLRDAIVQTAVPRLHLAPSTLDLSGWSLRSSSARPRFPPAQCARTVEHARRGQTKFTYVLVDCPPSLNLLDYQRHGGG